MSLAATFWAMVKTCAVVLLLASMAGCQGESSQRNTRAEGAPSGLVLSPDPVLLIGGGAEDQLYNVAGAVLLADAVAVANAGTRQILLFDRSGQQKSATGREGAGPGEFRSISGLWRFRGDSLLVWDGLLGRFAVLDGTGRWSRSGQLHQTERFPAAQVQGVFPDGSMFAIANTFVANPRPGMHDYSMDVVRYGPDGRFRNTLLTDAPSFSLFRGAAPYSWPTPAGGNRRFAVRGCALLTGYSTNDTLQVVGCDGVSHQPLVLGLERRLLASADAEAMRGRMLDALRRRVERGEWTAAQASPQRQFLEEVPIPTTLPAYADTYVDPAARLWVLEYPSPGDSTRVLHVFAPDGTRLAEVRLPDGARVLDLGTSELALLRRDADGIERIEVYRLTR